MTELDFRALNAEINNNALSEEKLPNRIKILEWGKNSTTDGDVWLNDESLELFDAIQKKIGRDEDVAIDFEHNSVPGSKEWVPGQARDIAGYGNPELIKGDGLYLNDIKWTPVGEEKAKNYKDLSPACPVTKDGVVTGLHSCALTTNGAVYGLKFYAANVDELFKIMAVKDYNKLGANAGVKEVNGKYIVNPKPLSVDDAGVEKAEPLHPIECLCGECMSADEADLVRNKISEFKAEMKLTKMSSEIKNSVNGTKTMSAKPAQPYNNMDNKIKLMAEGAVEAPEGQEDKDGKLDSERVLFAFLANFIGEHPEFMEQLTKKSNTEEGGLKQWSAKVGALESEMKSFKAELNEKQIEAERQAVIFQATKDGKIITLSANAIKKLDLADLKEYVGKLETKVPMKSQLKTLSADSTTGKPSRAKAIESFSAMLNKK